MAMSIVALNLISLDGQLPGKNSSYSKEEAEAKKRAEAEQRAKAKAEREALARAQAAVKALPALERLMLAEEYRQGAGAGRSASWDAVKGDFRDGMERIQFNAWLQARFKASGK